MAIGTDLGQPTVYFGTCKAKFKNMGTSSRDYYFNLWLRFEEAGGTDKNRMITLSTWLLAFIAGIVGYIFTHNGSIVRLSIDNPNELLAPSIAGLLIALLVMNVVKGFSFYANFNWACADEIAKEHLEDIIPVKGKVLGKMKRKTHDPYTEMAPIFRTFYRVAWGLVILFIFFILMSIEKLM